jgi:hypothetical protein
MTGAQRLEAALASIAAQVERAQRDGARLLETDMVLAGVDGDAIEEAVERYLESAKRSRETAIDEMRDRLRLAVEDKK